VPLRSLESQTLFGTDICQYGTICRVLFSPCIFTVSIFSLLRYNDVNCLVSMVTGGWWWICSCRCTGCWACSASAAVQRCARGNPNLSQGFPEQNDLLRVQATVCTPSVILLSVQQLLISCHRRTTR